MIYITGDCHGNFERFNASIFPEQNEMAKDDYEIICGNRKAIVPEPIVIIENPRTRRLYAYYKQLNKVLAA